MGKKEDYHLNLPNDVGSSFDKEDDILNFRPQINFVAPDHELEFGDHLEEPPPVEEEARDRTRAVIEGLNELNKLAGLTGKRLDSRMESLGNLDMKLDPNVDAATIAAMKRAFSDKKDPTIITYDDYKKCLRHLENNASDKSAKEEKDYLDGFNQALSNPTKTNFGIQRPEIINSEGAGTGIEPIDLSAFQVAAVISLFALLQPMITDLVLDLLP